MKENKTPRNSKNQLHGFWIDYYNNGKIRFKGYFINDTKYGYWIDNWNNIITLHLK